MPIPTKYLLPRYFDQLASMELYSIYCYSDEESEKESKVKISSSLFKFQSTHLME